MSHNTFLNICSLNCNSLRKTHQPSARASLIRCLRLQAPHLIALQETHATTDDITKSFDIQFCAHSSIWTPHCGLVSLSTDLTLTRITLDLGQYTDRIIFAEINSRNSTFMPF